MKIRLFISSLAIALLTFGLSTSCQKKTDCKLTIKTVDAGGMPLGGAKVKLFANVKTSTGATVEADLKAEGISDEVGVSTYTFKLPAILDVKATTISVTTTTSTPITTSLTGVGIVKLEEGKSVEKTITVK